MYFDSHAHLTSEAMLEDLDQVLQRAQDAAVRQIVNICTDGPSLEKGLELAQRYPWIFNTASTTPHDVEKEGEGLWPRMAAAAREGKLVAVGETGLDYYYEHSNREIQKEFFRRYLSLAKECQLPVVIHCRDAFDDFFQILDEEYCTESVYAPGVLHCFTGTLAEAHEVIRRGWYLSLSGIATFKKSEELREVAKIVPLDRLLIETDSPYLAPQGHRGKRNEPSFLPATCACLAGVLGVEVEELARQTAENAQRFFGLKPAEM